MKKIEEQYKILDQISHILLRPGTYVGSNKPNKSLRFILNESKIEEKSIEYIPSFIKILDEVLTNSVDESKRNSKLNKIDVEVNTDEGFISVTDNGGIPVVIHKEYKMYVPEVIFGNLMSGSNYDDNDERIVAGLNGLGSKLTNVFSNKFIVSTCDGKNSFIQEYSSNMRERSKPVIKRNKNNHTTIKFYPDFSQFGIEVIDDNHFKMIEKRVYDLAACNTHIKFYFNSKLINFNSFENYIKMYKSEYFFEESNDKTWSIGISHSDNGFKQISFANSTETYDGGTHVEYIMNQILIQLREFFIKKYKTDIRPNDIRSHIFLFLNSTIINPSFSSQTKEKLITEVKNYGYSYEVSKKMIQLIIKSEIVNRILDWVEQKKKADEGKLERELNRKILRTKVDKLIDAKSKERWKCSLGIFEGDCLHEDTNIRILRKSKLIDVKIKDINTNDLVITHNNSFSNINAFTKKIRQKSIIKLKNNEELISSKSHKWFVYDFENNEFYFEKTQNIDKKKHKIVKNYLAFVESLLSIEYNDGYLLKLLSGDIINTNPEHKFAIYDKEINKFLMCKAIDLKKDKHYLVNIFKL